MLLLLPQQMNLELYLDLRIISQYESLWDSVSKLFLKGSDVFLLKRAMETINILNETAALGQSNAEKATLLQTATLAPLKEAAADLEIEHAILEDDQREELALALTRASLIAKNWDIRERLEELDPNKSTSVISFAIALLDRGTLGLADDEKVRAGSLQQGVYSAAHKRLSQMIERALDLLYMFILWKTAAIPDGEPSSRALITLRDSIVEKTTELAIGQIDNVNDAVKRAAFRTLLELKIVAKHRSEVDESTAEFVDMTIEEQYRCSGFIQAEIERYASNLSGQTTANGHADDEDDEDSRTEDGATATNPKSLGEHRRVQTRYFCD